MVSSRFRYLAPSTIQEAASLLDRYGEGARVLAGGQSLIPLMKMRLAAPEYIIDLNRITDLEYVKEEGGVLRIGALTRHRDLENSDLVKRRYPLLADAAETIGDLQVRNLGTVGGAMAHADPASDWGAAFLALETEVEATSAKGIRTIPLDEFFVDTYTTALEPGEMLTEIRVSGVRGKSGGSYKKLKRKAGDFATVGVAAQVQLDGKGAVTQGRIALTAVGPTPFRAQEAENYLRGRTLDETTIGEAARLAAQAAEPSADLRGSEDYKRAMVEVFTRRALRAAVERARGGG
ncbi:MAG: FAD binding domain-containing protein, partial [Thermoplasmata archaeon]